jgi:hypothetical protein
LKRAAAFVATLAFLITLVGGSAVTQPTSWMYADGGRAAFLSWTKGTAEFASMGDPTSASGPPVIKSSVPISGTEANGKISLRIGRSSTQQSVRGTIDSGSLRLTFLPSIDSNNSEKFKPADAVEFTHQVASLTACILKQRDTATAAPSKRVVGCSVDGGYVYGDGG